MRYKVVYTNQYKKALKKVNRRDSSVLADINKVIDVLVSNKSLAKKYKDHKLSGTLKDFRELHIRPDLLLVYQKHEDILVLLLVNIGSHNDLF